LGPCRFGRADDFVGKQAPFHEVAEVLRLR
jgi:hypothetical protein